MLGVGVEPLRQRLHLDERRAEVALGELPAHPVDDVARAQEPGLAPEALAHPALLAAQHDADLAAHQPLLGQLPHEAVDRLAHRERELLHALDARLEHEPQHPLLAEPGLVDAPVVVAAGAGERHQPRLAEAVADARVGQLREAAEGVHAEPVQHARQLVVAEHPDRQRAQELTAAPGRHDRLAVGAGGELRRESVVGHAEARPQPELLERAAHRVEGTRLRPVEPARPAHPERQRPVADRLRRRHDRQHRAHHPLEGERLAHRVGGREREHGRRSLRVAHPHAHPHAVGSGALVARHDAQRVHDRAGLALLAAAGQRARLPRHHHRPVGHAQHAHPAGAHPHRGAARRLVHTP